MPSHLQPMSTTLTGARQTMMSWARVIDAAEAVPEVFQDAYQALAEGGAPPYAVLAPPQAGRRGHKPGERLVCDLGDRLYVLELAGRQVTTTGFCYPEVGSLEVGNILLYSWFSVHGRSLQGGAAAVTVEFNEATLRHFGPFFKKMRPAPVGADPIALAAEREKLEGLSGENFKFMNFGRECLTPGERVLQVLYQPAMRQPLVSLLGRSLYRSLSLAHLTILTDKEVILIGDAEGIAEKERSKYGGVQRYLPLRGLAAVRLEQEPGDVLALTFQLKDGATVAKRFEAARRAEVEGLKERLEGLIG